MLSRYTAWMVGRARPVVLVLVVVITTAFSGFGCGAKRRLSTFHGSAMLPFRIHVCSNGLSAMRFDERGQVSYRESSEPTMRSSLSAEALGELRSIIESAEYRATVVAKNPSPQFRVCTASAKYLRIQHQWGVAEFVLEESVADLPPSTKALLELADRFGNKSFVRYVALAERIRAE